MWASLRNSDAIQEMREVIEEVKPFNKFECQKCGKEFKRGLFMHEKHCKGVQ